MHEMQKMSSETGYIQPIGTVKVEVNVGCNRPLTRKEQDEIRECIDKISFMIYQTGQLQDPMFLEALKQEREKLLACFPTAVYVKEIPNGYDPNRLMNPWFSVTTPKGVIKIGWRKRVINIDWNESDIQVIGGDLFGGEMANTTVCAKSIHAWSYEKAQEYISRLLAYETEDTPTLS